MALECLSKAAPTHRQVDWSMAKADLVLDRLGCQFLEFPKSFCCLHRLFQISESEKSTPQDPT